MKRMKHKKIGRPVGSKDKHPRKRRCWKLGYKCRTIKPKKQKKQKHEKHQKGYVPQVFPYVKSYKFLGYCKCGGMVSAKDLISKFIYTCPMCGKRARLKTLKEAINRPRIDRKDDREEIHHHIDTLPLEDNVIDPKDFKVQE